MLIYMENSKNFSEISNFFGVNKIYDNQIEVPVIHENEDKLNSLIKGGKIHYNIRKVIQPYLKPGLSVKKLGQIIDDTTRKLCENKGMNQGIGFPCSLSVSNCAAHYTPADHLEDIILKKSDNIKIDFGVVVNGWIVDCAFSVYFDEKYLNLHEAVKEATYNGIKNAGVDQNINDWARSNQEIMESYEIELDNNTYKIKPIKNLGGHNILYGKIHGGEFLPCAASKFNDNAKFKEGVYAIETFGCYGYNDYVHGNYAENSVYMWNINNLNNLENILSQNITKLKTIDLALKMRDQFNSLPFCDRFIKRINNNPKEDIQNLLNKNILKKFPPLYTNSMVAQYEHTIVLSDSKKTIISQFKDY